MKLPWRLPFGAVPTPGPPVPPTRQADYPALRERFADLDRVLLPRFVEHDATALAAQRRHRRYQLVLIVGATLTSVFGAVQAAVGSSDTLGIIIAVLGLSTAAVITRQRKDKPLSRHLTERAKAEELRSLYFRYLSGSTAPGVDGLQAEVDVIVAAKNGAAR